MQLPEIKIAIAAIRSARGLPLLEDFKRRMPHMDLLDWLQFSFGFQVPFFSLYFSSSDCIY
ncbi:hypothetical protein ACS0TY_003066 [Phlomoides rotata]